MSNMFFQKVNNEFTREAQTTTEKMLETVSALEQKGLVDQVIYQEKKEKAASPV